MNKFLTSIAAALTLGATAFAVSTTLSSSSDLSLTRERKERPAVQRESTPRPTSAKALRIKGGADNSKPLYGMVAAAYDGVLNGYTGPVEIHADANHVKVSPSTSFHTFSGCYMDGKFFSVGYNKVQKVLHYQVYDVETWELESRVNYTFTSSNTLPLDLVYDPETKRVYGCFLKSTTDFWSTSEANLGWVDFENAGEPVVLIGDMGVRMRGMAADKDGLIYGIGMDDKLYTINKYDATITKIADLKWDTPRHNGNPSAPWQYGYESAVVDWDTGLIYFSMNDSEEDSFIVRIDPTSGSVTYVADYGYYTPTGTQTCEIFSALYFKQNTEAAKGTPQKVENLKSTAKGVENAAELSFTMPTLDTDGGSLSGNLKWTVSVDELELLSGTAAPGENVTTTVTTPTDGMMNFGVTASAGNLKSTPEYTRIYVGNDYPELWLQPTAFSDGSDITVTWRAASALNQGNMSPVTYKVVRQPDGAVITESTNRNAVTDKAPSIIKALYSYDVTPISGSKVGTTKSTREFYAGEIFDLPHINDFSEELLFNQYPVIDNNSDNNTWWIDSAKKHAVYSGSTTMAADDYLCIGPFLMSAGSVYTLSFTASAYSVDKVAVYIGTDPQDVATFKTELTAPTNINSSAGSKFIESTFIPTSSGRYYFAIKACSVKSTSSLYISDMKVTGVTAKMPVAPDVVFTPTATGAILDITVPKANIDGSMPANVTAVKIYRDNELLATITDKIADGAKITYTDNKEATRGVHIYSVAAVNKSGEGANTSINGYLGLDIPGKPTNLRVYEDTNTSGLIHLTWDIPTRGANGGYINPNDVTYNISWMSYGVAGSGETNINATNKYDHQIKGTITEQDIIAFTVKAQNSQGTSNKSGSTRSTYFGPALPLPLFESWTGNKTTSGIWSGEAVLEDAELFESWWDYGPGNMNAQDLDGNMLKLSTNRESGGCHRMRSPRVTLKDTENPTLIFYLYHTAATENFRVEVAADDQPMTLLQEIELPTTEQKKWRRIEIPLNKYKNASYIQLGFVGTANRAMEEFVAIDNVNITDAVDADLMVIGITGSERVANNQKVSVSATIRNNSANLVERASYTVSLLKNGKVIEELPGMRVDAFRNVTMLFEDVALPTDPASTVYTVEVNFAADKVTSNNTSNPLPVEIVTSDYPTPRNLKATSDNGVRLSWDAPDMNLIENDKVTETFDSYESFIINNIGNWTLYDGDALQTVTISTQLGKLDYPNIGAAMAWQVIDPEKANIINGAWYPRSGKHMLVSFQAVKDNGRQVNCDDWLISPELCGRAQHISFYARAGMNAYSPELMDIYYSTTGNAVSDFKKLASDVKVPYASDWVEYKYYLPEGARYFAIVHKSFNQFALLIDDITYSPAGSATEDVTLLGYRIYRDDVRLNNHRLVQTTSYNDIYTETGVKYTYHVSAVWSKDESGLSNPASCEAAIVTGIESVEGSASTITVVTDHLEIGVSGVEAGEMIYVYNLSGSAVASVCAKAGTTTIPVAHPGIYVVKVASEAMKVAVR